MAAILHKIRRGETFLSICLAYGLDYQRLINLNLRFLQFDVLDPHAIKAGKTIVIGDSADPFDIIRIINKVKK